MTIHEVLVRLSEVTGAPARLSGNGSCSTRCPSHDDRNASLSVSAGREGRILVRCHAGCSTKEIVDALGLFPRDLFQSNGSTPNGATAQSHPNRSRSERPKQRRTIETVYPYSDAAGETVFEVSGSRPSTFSSGVQTARGVTSGTSRASSACCTACRS